MKRENNHSHLAMLTANENTVSFYTDSGSTDHIINNKNLLTIVNKLNEHVVLNVSKNNTTIMAYESGMIKAISNKNVPININNILYVQDSKHNLLSIKQLTKSNIKIIFDKDKVFLYKENQLIASGSDDGRLYSITLNNNKNKNCYSTFIQKNNLVTSNISKVDVLTSIEDIPMSSTRDNEYISIFSNRANKNISMFSKNNKNKNTFEIKNIEKEEFTNSFEIWHKRLGHIGNDNLKTLLKNNMVTGIPENSKFIFDKNKICECCIYSKITRLPFAKEKEPYSTRPFEIIHSDVVGPLPNSISNETFFVTILDDYTHYLYVHTLKSKADVFEKFKHFSAIIQNQHNFKICKLYCDNGRKYLSNEFKNFCNESGIELHVNIPYTPELNDKVKELIEQY